MARLRIKAAGPGQAVGEPLGRQPAEGGPGPAAPPAGRRPPARRADARHRRRLEGRDLSPDRRAGRRRARRSWSSAPTCPSCSASATGSPSCRAARSARPGPSRTGPSTKSWTSRPEAMRPVASSSELFRSIIDDRDSIVAERAIAVAESIDGPIGRHARDRAARHARLGLDGVRSVPGAGPDHRAVRGADPRFGLVPDRLQLADDRRADGDRRHGGPGHDDHHDRRRDRSLGRLDRGAGDGVHRAVRQEGRPAACRIRCGT